MLCSFVNIRLVLMVEVTVVNLEPVFSVLSSKEVDQSQLGEVDFPKFPCFLCLHRAYLLKIDC